jgi:hypothetical protein
MPGIVEGGPHWGAPAVIAIIVVGAAILVFPLPLALTLAFTAIVGARVGGGGAA